MCLLPAQGGRVNGHADAEGDQAGTRRRRRRVYREQAALRLGAERLGHRDAETGQRGRHGRVDQVGVEPERAVEPGLRRGVRHALRDLLLTTRNLPMMSHQLLKVLRTQDIDLRK